MMEKPEIVIEVGTEQQKKLISQEIENFLIVIDEFIGTWFDAVIIPSDFDQSIRKLTNDTEYTAFRGEVTVQAKFIQSKHGNTIVFNPIIFSDIYDKQVRYHLYLHETGHFIFSLNKKDITDLSLANKIYFENILTFYDEFRTERFSWLVCQNTFKEKSLYYLNFVNLCIDGHWQILNSTEEKLKQIKDILLDFRFHQSGDRFLKEMRPLLKPIMLSFFYFLAVRTVIPKQVKKSIGDFPFPFNQPPSIEIAKLCLKTYPNPLDYENALEKSKSFYNQFGFKLEDHESGFLFVRIIDNFLD